MGGVCVMCDGWCVGDGWCVMSTCVHVCVEVVIIQDHFKLISPHTQLVYVVPQVNVYTHTHMVGTGGATSCFSPTLTCRPGFFNAFFPVCVCVCGGGGGG